MNIKHAPLCADKHTFGQVPIDTLHGSESFRLTENMALSFREALIWHLDQHQTQIAHLSRVTGVSRNVINKLKSGANSTTTPENALLIAAYYNKSLEDFVSCEGTAPDDGFRSIMKLLEEDEREAVHALMQGFLLKRGPK